MDNTEVRHEVGHRIRKLVFFAPLAIVGLLVFMALGGAIVMLLWNWLLPPLFGWSEIGFWQALGLLALCRILFGGFGGRGMSGGHMRRRMADRVADRVVARMGERWDGMSPEEKERFRQRIRERFGTESPAGDARD